MVFVRSQHRPEITMYSSIMLYVFLCYMLRIVRCKVHPKKYRKKQQSTENCELF